MLREENKCLFEFKADYQGLSGGGFYGFIVTFKFKSIEFTGVLAPVMKGFDWWLIPEDKVNITRQPKESLRFPAYEIDE